MVRIPTFHGLLLVAHASRWNERKDVRQKDTDPNQERNHGLGDGPECRIVGRVIGQCVV